MDELILMEKDGEQINVHPAIIAEHQRLGWRVVEVKTEPVIESISKPQMATATASARKHK